MHVENVYGPIDQRGLGNALYSVSGFRSLQEFEICLTPGLNVFIGPNGSGKTNFIDFLDFLTVLVNQNVASAVSATGGVARVFSQESLKRKIPRVIAKISGVADINPFHIEGELRKSLFKFEYEVDIRYSKFHTAVYIANEKIKLKNLFSEEDVFECDTTVGSLEIHRFNPLIDEPPRWKVGTYLAANAIRNPFRYIHAHRLVSRGRGEKNQNQQRVESLAQPPYVSPDESILSSRLPFPALDAIRSAIARGRAFNLNPQSARTPDDISTPPIVSSSGSGLTATIYQMQQSTRSDNRPTFVRRRMPKDALNTVLQWTKLVMPDLQSITATADPHSGKYLVYLNVEGGDRLLKIPLQASSDGMLRWLAFACLIVSKGVEYTFEEPENYLHPKMQQYLIDLIRDSVSDKTKFDRYIISTHSETVINQCTPGEIVLFSFDNGRTKCKRITNANSLIDQVNKTGFGLGHYYAMNALR
jgi:predicted ATPase